MNEENDERLWNALDQLSSASALERDEWYTTTAALNSLQRLLLKISFGQKTETTAFADISFPDQRNRLYIWFLLAQDQFQSNIASQLMTFVRILLERLKLAGDDELFQYMEWICQSLNLLQGVLLLHPSSRTLFTRRPYMNVLIDLLQLQYGEDIHLVAIQTIVSALVDRPDNLRTFESSNGLKRMSALFLHDATSHKIKVKVLEFLYFYLIPEVPPENHARDGSKMLGEDESSTGHRSQLSQASTVKVKLHTREGAEHSMHDRAHSMTKTTEEKQLILGRYFSNIDALVKDLNEFKPFGEF